MRGTDRRSWIVGLATIAWFATAVALSAASGVPRHLPAVALGSDAVLYAERVAALMIAFVVIAVILDRGRQGDLPLEFRGVRYADREATEQLAKKASAAIAALADSVDDLHGRRRTGDAPEVEVPSDVSSLDVTVVDATGNRAEEASVPCHVAAGRIASKLVELMELPQYGPDGQPLDYKLHHVKSGREISDAETLVEAGVGAGDVLRLICELPAGGGPMGEITAGGELGEAPGAGSTDGARTIAQEIRGLQF